MTILVVETLQVVIVTCLHVSSICHQTKIADSASQIVSHLVKVISLETPKIPLSAI